MVIHLVGFAMTFGALAAAAFRKQFEFTPVMSYGILISLLSGVFLMMEWGGYEPNHVKLGIKFVILMALGGVLGVGSARAKKSGEPVLPALFWTAMALSLSAAAVAVIW